MSLFVFAKLILHDRLLKGTLFQKVALVFQRVQIMIVLINKSILQIKLATQEKMICLEKSKR